MDNTLRGDGTPKASTNGMLPSPEQTWVHAVDSRRTLLDALQDDAITAVETDLIMGKCNNGTSIGSESDPKIEPIMAHPPNTESDLSMVDFVGIISNPQGFVNSNRKAQSTTVNAPNNTVNKVIKLDFKEMETVEPTLQAIVTSHIQTTESSVFFLNADILPGPGRRENGAVTIPAAQFLETCLKYIKQQHQQSSAAQFAFSLGFKTDFADTDGYTADNAQSMSDLIDHYKLVEQNVGVVLALNARLLEKNLSNFDGMLAKYPEMQLLLWTGKGEPPIPLSLYQNIRDYFHQTGMSQRIGYDCQVRQD